MKIRGVTFFFFIFYMKVNRASKFVVFGLPFFQLILVFGILIPISFIIIVHGNDNHDDGDSNDNEGRKII